MTRGIRNNNPLNIRCSSAPWNGKVQKNTDGEFEQFVSMQYGFRAAFLTIQTYILKHNCDTIRKIIYRWAPPEDGNDTENYVISVVRYTGICGSEPITNYDRRIKKIVAAMALVESGAGIVDYFGCLDKAWDEFEPKRLDKC